MLRLIPPVSAPLGSVFILMLGGGLMYSLTPLHLQAMGYTEWIIGMISAIHAIGMMLGSFKVAGLILRVGHIRTYACFASLIAAVTLLQGLWLNIYAWALLRFIAGYAVAALYLVIESWMLSASESQTRGKLLSLYMVAIYGAQGLGQFFLKIASFESLILYALVTILASLSVIPLSLTKVGHPEIHQPRVLNLIDTYRISPSGVIGCMASGLLLGSVSSMVPISSKALGFNLSDIAWIMFITITGGMMLQFPVGYVSDRYDRRSVLGYISLGGAIVCLPVLLFGHMPLLIMALFMFIFGGAIYTIYPVVISQACESFDPGDIVSATQALILAYGIGAILGPLFASGFIELLGPRGLYLYYGLASSLLGFFFLYRTRVKAPPEEHTAYLAVPSTTPVVAELDPRMGEEEKESFDGVRDTKERF